MIQLTPQMRLLVAVEAQDFRKGIDGLARVCREVLVADPFSGCVFVFRNRRQTAVRLLCYDGRVLPVGLRSRAGGFDHAGAVRAASVSR